MNVETGAGIRARLRAVAAGPGPEEGRGGGLRLAGGPVLAAGRVHEACGPGRRSLALWLAAGGTGGGTAGGTGAVIWIHPGWLPERPYPDGFCATLAPGRLILVAGRRPVDLLWAAEEALRAGAAGLVVADLPAPPGLTPVRRLHLAAEAGCAARGRGATTGLILTPGEGGAAGVESRWHLAPRHGAAGSAWRLERRRARTDPPAAWTVTRPGDGLGAGPSPCPAPDHAPPDHAQPDHATGLVLRPAGPQDANGTFAGRREDAAATPP